MLCNWILITLKFVPEVQLTKFRFCLSNGLVLNRRSHYMDQSNNAGVTWPQWVNSYKHINSLWPSDTIWRHKSGSKLAQVMACCLMAPSHYLNLLYPPAQQSWRGVYWFHLVRLSVRIQNPVCTVSSTILTESISYLHILTCNTPSEVAW